MYTHSKITWTTAANCRQHKFPTSHTTIPHLVSTHNVPTKDGIEQEPGDVHALSGGYDSRARLGTTHTYQVGQSKRPSEEN